MMYRLLGGLLCMLWSFSAFGLEAGLSARKIEVRSDISGMSLVVFGSLDRDRRSSDNVVVLVRGPEKEAVLWKKERLAGVWTNYDPKIFPTLRSFHALSAVRPVSADRFFLTQEEESLEKEALMRLLERKDLFLVQSGGVEFLGERLFRAKIDLPPNAPVGEYEITIVLLEQPYGETGRIIRQVVLPLSLSKPAWDQMIFWFAHQWSFFYGLLAVFLALLTGWVMSNFLQRLFLNV